MTHPSRAVHGKFFKKSRRLYILFRFKKVALTQQKWPRPAPKYCAAENSPLPFLVFYPLFIYLTSLVWLVSSLLSFVRSVFSERAYLNCCSLPLLAHRVLGHAHFRVVARRTHVIFGFSQPGVLWWCHEKARRVFAPFLPSGWILGRGGCERQRTERGALDGL